MYTLEITESAERDLDRIVEYIGVRLANPPAALALLDEIDRVSESLRESPELFALCADTRLAERGYRKALVRAYILVFEIEVDTVRVLRFFHSSEDYQNKL